MLTMIEKSVGVRMYELAEELFPICRSITGEGIRYTLNRLKKEVPQIVLHEIPTGTKVFDWVVPKEWEISEAYIEDMKGNRIVDFQKNNLHVVGYSIPIDAIVSGDELQAHLYSLPEHPDWIPYVTSYYKERWGFCVTENSRKKLTDNQYHVVIKSKLFDGSLTYAELLIPGQVSDEIFFSTYACHPSMANNELSGPVVQIELAKLLMSRKNKYSYRLIWIPETIGSITYLSKNLDYMKEHIIAGYNITCVGDDRAVSYIQSRKGNTIADRAAKNVLKYIAPDYMEYSYLNRGSDERQYNAPGIDLPVCSICRTKFHEYPEYHTSADDLKLISPKGLEKSYYIYKEIIEALEVNEIYRINCLCEPQLGPRGLYPTECFNRSSIAVKDMMDFIAYADGTMDLIEISDKINVPVKKLDEIAQVLLKANLFTKK
jgi:aminopeptidase-like protein